MFPIRPTMHTMAAFALRPARPYAARKPDDAQAPSTGDHFVRFAGTMREMGGVMLDGDELTRELHRWSGSLITQIHALDARNLQRDFPDVEKACRRFDLGPDYIGIPPAIRDDSAPDPKPYKPNTHRALVAIFYDMMDHLPPASNLITAVAQMRLGFVLLKARAMEKAHCILRGQFEPTGGMSHNGYAIQPLRDVLYTAIFLKHIVFIGHNGAMQILALPTPKELAELIRTDPQAQLAIEDKQPLAKPKIAMKLKALPTGDLPGTLQHLAEMAEDAHSSRIGSGGWKDLHTLMEAVPFDYPAHIAAGRMHVLYNRPGKDKNDVWQSICPPHPSFLTLPHYRDQQGS